MAKRPTPAAEKPAAPTAPPSADAAATATNTQGAGADAERSAAAPGGATGEGDASPAGGGGASGDASSSNDLAVLIDEVRVACATFLIGVLALKDAALAGSDGDVAQALAAIQELNLDLPIGVSALRDRLAAAEGDLVEIQARSRDGKPFRRAGHVFGADFTTYLVSEDALARIRADRGIVLKALD